MKDKPTFDSLPAVIQERLLWNMELDYDSYEGSKADTIHLIMVGSTISRTNELIIKNYAALGVDTLVAYLGQERDAAAKSVAQMNRLMTDLIHEFGTTE